MNFSGSSSNNSHHHLNHDTTSSTSSTSSNDNINISTYDSSANLLLSSNATNNSSNANSSSDQSNKSKRNPLCSRCRNHGKTAQVKGHKRHCEYRECQCDGCELVHARQLVSAAQIKRRRYQKQDEECGRHVEISPPVLTRSPSNPASLIAKHVGLHHHHHHHSLYSPQDQHQSEQQHQHQRRKQIIAAAAAAAAATNPLFQIPTSFPLFPIPSHYGSAAAAAAAATTTTQSMPPHMSHHQSHHSSAQPSQSLSQSQPLLTQNLAAHHHLVGLPSPQDQLNLVKELDRAFGPLVIFAWLKAERFNLQKIRNSIEMSKIPFEELLQTTFN